MTLLIRALGCTKAQKILIILVIHPHLHQQHQGHYQIKCDLILHLFEKELSAIEPNQEFRDSKTELQELLQSKKSELPKYVTKETANGFESSIKLGNKSYEGYGNSKRQAEIAVAKVALDNLKLNNA